MTNKKGKKMSKNLDLDFNDIVGKTTPLVSKPITETKATSDDYKLTLYSSETGLKFLYLSECSSNEFLSWASQLFPIGEVDPTSFNTLDQRLRALKQIMRFHTETFSFLKKANSIRRDH